MNTMDELKILISADVNIGKSIGDINKAIRQLQKSGQLVDLNLNLNIDQGFRKAIADFTKTAEQLNKIIKEQNKVIKEEVISIENLDGSITKLTRQHLANGDVIEKNNKKIKESVTTKKEELKTTEALTDEVNRLADARKKSSSVSYDQNGNIKKESIKTGDDYNTLTTNTDRYGNVTQQIDQNNEKLYQEEVKRQQKLADIERSRIKNIDAAEYAAYQDKQKREEHLFGKRIQDQKKAYDLAKAEDGIFNRKRLENEEKFARKQQETLNKIANAKQKFGHHNGLNGALDDLEKQVKDTNLISAKTKDWNNQLSNVNSQISKSTAGLKAMRVESVGIIDGLKVGLAKVPIWAVATTAIYAPIRGLNTAVDTILAVDKQITELHRVMDRDTNFDNMLSGSIDLARELGRSITDVNEALTGFARQGFNETEILDLTKSATLAQNISELTASESMDAITAAMVVFNIEASKSISIVDAINEVDNNFAVTSKDLAIGMQKSASAANTFGVSMNELLGDLTSIMQVTRESGSVAGNSLKTIYSRLTTMQPAIDALGELGLSIYDGNGDLKTATVILDEVAEAYKHVNEETKQNTAVALAGRYQLSRFLAMVDNRNIAHDATTKALYSENSAMRENAAYMESYEARINLMKTAWQEFSLKMGEAFIGDAIVTITDTLAWVAPLITEAVDQIGLLPLAIGTATVAFLLFGKTSRKVLASTILDMKLMASTTVRTGEAMKYSFITPFVTGFQRVSTGLKNFASSFAGMNSLSMSSFANFGGMIDKVNTKMLRNIATQRQALLQNSISNIPPYLLATNKGLGIVEKSYNRLALKAKLLGTVNTIALTPIGAAARVGAIGLNLLARGAAIAAVAVKGLAISIASMAAPMAIFMGIGFAIEKITGHFRKLKEEQKAVEARQNTITESWGNQKEKVSELLSEYERLSNVTNGGKTFFNEEQEEKYKNVIQTLSELMPNLVASINEKGEAHLKSTEAIKGEIEYAEELVRLKREQQIIDAKENFKNKRKGVDDDLFRADKLRDEVETKTHRGSVIKNALKVDISESDLISKEIELLELEKKIKLKADGIRTEINSLSIALLEAAGIKLSDNLANEMSKLVSALEVSTLSPEQLEQKSKDISDLFMTINSLKGAKTSEEIKTLEDKLGSLGTQLGLTDIKIKEIIDSSSKLPLENIILADEAEEAAESVKDYGQIISNTVSDLSELNNVIDKVSKGQSLNGSEVDKLIRAYPSLRNSIIQTADGYSFEEKAIDLVRKEKLDLLETTQLAEAGISAAVYNNLLNRLENYDIELASIQSLADAKAALAKIDEENAKNDPNYELHNPNYVNESAALSEQLRTIGQIRDNFNKLYAKPSFGVTDSGGSKKSSSSDKDKDKPKKKDTTEAHINSIMEEANAQAELNAVLEQSISIDKYLDSKIKKTSKLINDQSTEINLLSSANQKLAAEQASLQKKNTSYSLPMDKWVDANGEATESFLALYNSMSSGANQDILEALFDQYSAYTKQINENKKAIIDLTEAQRQNRVENQKMKQERTQNFLGTLSEKVGVYNDKIAESEKIQGLFKEGTKEYNEEIKKQLALYKQQQNQLLLNIKFAKDKLASGELDLQQTADMNAFLAEQTSLLTDNLVAQNAYKEAWQDSVRSTTEGAMKVLEDYYKQQQELEEKALDKNLKNYEDYINARKRLLRDQDAEDDFKKDREKLQKEELELRKQIDLLSLDSSLSAKSKREDLEVELQKKLEEIADLELQYGRDKRDQNYDDLLTEKQKEVQAQKDALDDKWHNELQSDKYYSALKQALLEDNVAAMETTLKAFADNVSTYMDNIGKSIDLNLIDKMNSTDQFTNIQDSINSTVSSKPSTGATTQYDSTSLSAWTEYLNNKKEAESIKKTNPARYEELSKRNTQLRSQYKFTDGNYATLSSSNVPIFSAEKGGMTPSWGKSGKIGMLHENELIMNKVQTKDILRVHEIAQGIIGQFQGIASSLFTRPSTAVAGDTYFEFNLNGKASKDDANLFIKAWKDHTRKR